MASVPWLSNAPDPDRFESVPTRLRCVRSGHDHGQGALDIWLDLATDVNVLASQTAAR